MQDAPMFEGTRMCDVAGVLLVVGLLGLGGCERKSSVPATRAAEPTPAPAVAVDPLPPAAAPVPVASAPVPPPAPVPAEPNTFTEVTARLDQGGGLFFYLSTEEWLKGLSDSVGLVRDFASAASAGKQDAKEREQTERQFKLLANLIKTSGIEEITGIGGSSFAIEPGLYRNKLFVHHHKSKGTGFLWSAIGKEPRPMTLLQCLPQNTAFATSSDLNIGELLGAIVKEIDQAEIFEARMMRDQLSLQLQAGTGMTLDEALTAFGDSISVVVTLDPEESIEIPVDKKKESIPRPALALLLETPDDRIFKQVEKAMGNNPELIKVDEPELKMRTMVLPILPQFPIRLTAAQWRSYFIMASDDALIRAMIEAQSTGKGLVSTPEFSKLSDGLPTEGNGFNVATQLFVETWSRFQQNMLKNQPGMPAEQLALFEKITSMQKPSAAYAVTSHVENGWLTIGKGSRGASQLLAPLVIAPVAVLAAVGFPAIATAKDHARATQSLNNAKQIGLACHMYATDNAGNFPPNLEALLPAYLPNKEVFKSPFAPQEEIGYKYTPGLKVNSPGNPVLIEDKFSGKEKYRVVVTADGAGTSTKVKD